MSWILGIEISHKNKRTKEKLKFSKAAHCHSCFCVVVNFFFLFLLLLLFLVSAFFSEEESDTAQEIFFLEFSAFPLTNENCSNQTSQIILQ